MKIDLKVYVIGCLNRNLRTHFVSCLEKERKYAIEGTFLWKNHTENVHQKLIPDLDFGNTKQPLHAKNIFKIRYFERGLSKSL